jgi:mycofactocin system transcriptional regulator
MTTSRDRYRGGERAGAGRPPATTHAAIEAAAFQLFRCKGFEETTLDEIASVAGVGRRTIFRYFPSKNDIPWGRFDAGLDALSRYLEDTPPEQDVLDAIHAAVLAFNRFDVDALAQHRYRMELILTTPALQAHSVVRYEQWRGVVTQYAARRYGLEPSDLLPRTIGHVSLALSISAYEQWLLDPAADLTELLARTAVVLRTYALAEDLSERNSGNTHSRL